MNPSFSRILAALVAVLLVLSFIPTSQGPAIEALLSKAGAGRMDQAARTYLEAQREQALKGFLLLSALKVGLAVLKSSEVGFILNIKVGDLAVAVYDYVDIGWKILLTAVAYFYIAEYLMQLASVINIWFLWIALVSSMVWLLVIDLRPGSVRLRAMAARTGLAGSVVAILLYIGLPLSLLGAGWVSSHITGEPILSANSLYEEMGENMPSLFDEQDPARTTAGGQRIRTSRVTVPVPYDGSDPSLAVTEMPGKDSEESIISLISVDNLLKLRNYLQQQARALASAVLKQTAAYIFNIVIFPVLTLLLVYWGVKYLYSLVMDFQNLS